MSTLQQSLVTRNSVLNRYGLNPNQLNELLPTLGFHVYQAGGRLYVPRVANRVLANLLAPRYANTPMQEYLNALEKSTFLYVCKNCSELLFFPDLQLGEDQLLHHCLRDRRSQRDQLGHLELIDSGALSQLAAKHRRLWSLDNSELALAS